MAGRRRPEAQFMGSGVVYQNRKAASLSGRHEGGGKKNTGVRQCKVKTRTSGVRKPFHQKGQEEKIQTIRGEKCGHEGEESPGKADKSGGRFSSNDEGKGE